MLGTQRKRPADLLDYDVTFERWLSVEDTLQDAAAVISGAETVTVERVVIQSPYVKVWLSGGITGDSAHVTVTATTKAGRRKEVVFALRITEC